MVVDSWVEWECQATVSVELYTWNKCPCMLWWVMIYYYSVVLWDSLVNYSFMVLDCWNGMNNGLMLDWGLLMNCVNNFWSFRSCCLRMSCWRLSYYGCLLGMHFLNVGYGGRMNCLSVSYCCRFLDLRMVPMVNNVNLVVTLLMMHILVHLSMGIAGFTQCPCHKK